MDFVDYSSVHEMLTRTVDRCGERTAYRTLLDGSGRSVSVTWKEFYGEVRAAARAMLALGVGRDEKVCILSYSCYRWVLVDLAVQSMGSVTVGIYQSLLAKDCRHIVDHSDAVLVFVQNRQQLAKMIEVRSEIPRVRRVVVMEDEIEDDGWVMGFAAFLALGATATDQALDQLLDERIAAVRPDDVAALVYTSGTTGVPKGAMLTHDNITFTAQSVLGSADIRPDDEVILFLPLAHIFARTCAFTSLIAGVTTTFARSLETLPEDFKLARPHWFPSVPRVYEKIFTKIVSGAEAKGGAALAIFRWAVRVGGEVSDGKVAKRPVPALTAFQYALANRLVFHKVQEALGGRVRWCISGGAPLTPSIGRFFHAAGVLILEGIGMTENTSFTNVNRVDDYRFGWVGPTGPGIDQKTGPDGEVLYRGRNVMKGYYKMPAETAETITADGWLHTGDLGEIDAHGHLRITGRKKDLIITAGGKNIAPSAIEGALGTSKYIAQACVIGDRRPFLTALVTLNGPNVEEWARGRGIAFSNLTDLFGETQTHDLIRAEIALRNRDLASFETIKDFRLVEEFTIENGLLTPTMKVKRNLAMERYADLIREMYQGG